MRWILKIAKTVLLIIVITLVQIGIREFLPFPFNLINIIFLSLAWAMLFTNSTSALWLVIPPTILVELFSSLPFGIYSAALIFGLSVASWLLNSVFTNHSTSIVLAAGIIGMSIFRLCFFVLIFINGFLYTSFIISVSILLEWLIEIILTSLFLTLLYFISQSFFKRLQPQFVRLQPFK